MKIVIAIDSFKGSATSSELNAATKAGVLEALPEANVVSFEIADGGEGTLSTLHAGLGGDWVTVETVDLLERPCEASYLLVGGQAFIESASVVGIDKITPSPETFEKATTKGLAKLFEDAVAQGAQEIYLTLGGTGTSDGGRGLFEALNGKVSEVKLYGISDVTNVYAGPEGYSIFFGKQKGGTSGQIAAQNESALAFAAKMKTERGIDLQKIPGTGAAGGLG
ncbi:MAG: glycerate kinase, partial [Streptococcaceae bacterium]|nr:glycerate kinase [Streptococcaceae bacterium]